MSLFVIVQAFGFLSVDFTNQRMFVNQSVTRKPGKAVQSTIINLYKKVNTVKPVQTTTSLKRPLAVNNHFKSPCLLERAQ